MPLLKVFPSLLTQSGGVLLTAKFNTKSGENSKNLTVFLLMKKYYPNSEKKSIGSKTF